MKVMSLPAEETLGALRDPATRRRLLELSCKPHQLSALANCAAKLIVETQSPANKRYE